LSGVLTQLWERGRVEWPQLPLGFDEFSASLRQRFSAELDAITDQLEAGDLYLACACVLAKPGAAEAFKTRYEPLLRQYVATVEQRREAIDELVQEVLVRLLVGDDESGPRLGSYSGRGPLRAWLRMAAVRRSLNAKRDVQLHAKIESRLAEAARPDDDPELTLLRTRYRPQLEAALRDALKSLPRAERGLLRLCYVEGLSLLVIARMRNWSKTTTSRRIATVREEVLAEAGKLLRQRMGVSEPDFQSLLGLLQSQLEIGMSALLATEGDPER
jgi:RNA polymerase sigma-70 factor (ECF subfamily)